MNATDLIDGGGIVRGQNIQSMRRIVQHSRSRVATAMEFSQLNFGVCKESGWSGGSIMTPIS